MFEKLIRLKSRFCFLALLVLALTFAAESAAHEDHGVMNSESTELGADAAFDREGGLWTVRKISGHIAVCRSVDRGKSWSNPVLVTPETEPTDTGGDARPKIALGSKGEIYVTWTRPLGKPYTGEVKFARSLDGGRTFSAPAAVHHDHQEITHRFDALAVNSRGQIFVAWIDKRDAVVAAQSTSASGYRGAAVYFAVSDDQGATFRGDFKAAEHTCECCRIALSITPDGGVNAMWRHVFDPDIRDHALATLQPDGSVKDLRRVTFENWRLKACPHHGPSLGEDSEGHLHAVWFSAPPHNEGVYYGRIGNEPVALCHRIGGPTAEHADLATAGHRVAIAWKEFDGERTRLRGMISDDEGATWQEERELASTLDASGNPRILTYNQEFFALWNTRDESLRVIALR